MINGSPIGLPPGSPYLFNNADDHLAAVLMDLGMPKNLARTTLYLSLTAEAISKHIERGAGLKQPEVSTAVSHMRDLGWIAERKVKGQGKGRPTHVYQLIKPFPDIVAELERENLNKISDIRTNLTRLSQIVGEL